MPIIRKQIEIEVYVQIEVQVARWSHLAFQNNTAPKNAMAYHPLNITSALKHLVQQLIVHVVQVGFHNHPCRSTTAIE